MAFPEVVIARIIYGSTQLCNSIKWNGNFYNFPFTSVRDVLSLNNKSRDFLM